MIDRLALYDWQGMQSTSTCDEDFVLTFKEGGGDDRLDLNVIVHGGKIDSDGLLCQCSRSGKIHAEVTRDVQSWM